MMEAAKKKRYRYGQVNCPMLCGQYKKEPW